MNPLGNPLENQLGLYDANDPMLAMSRQIGYLNQQAIDLATGGRGQATRLLRRGTPTMAATGGRGAGVRPYEVGRANDLRRRSRPGDELQIHHVPQQHPARQVSPQYNPRTAPAIVVPEKKHWSIPTQKGVYTGSMRDLVAKDLRDLRQYTDAPNSSLRELLRLYREMYPGL